MLRVHLAGIIGTYSFKRKFSAVALKIGSFTERIIKLDVLAT